MSQKNVDVAEKLRGGKSAAGESKSQRYIFYILAVCLLIAAFFVAIYPFDVHIALAGNANMTVEYGSEFIDPGAAAYKNGEDVTDAMEINGTVDMSKLGTYTILYSYRGDGLFARRAKRTVSVVDTSPAEILLAGNGNMLVLIGHDYEEPGYTATDNYDGDISGNVRVTGAPDSATEGVYEITYEVDDSSGNHTKVVRTVTVTAHNPLEDSIQLFSLEGFFPNATLKETADGGDSYINDTVFIGDSITFNMAYYSSIPIECVWTRSMLTPENITELKVNVYSGPSYGTALDNLAAYKPKRVVIAIGVSATAWMDPEYFTYLYTDFINQVRQVSPDTQIIIQAILPIDKRYDTSDDSFTNKKINDTNYYIGQMCEELSVKFLDPTSVMKDENGQAAQGYTYESDGIHPTEAAYELIINYIRTHTYPEN